MSQSELLSCPLWWMRDINNCELRGHYVLKVFSPPGCWAKWESFISIVADKHWAVHGNKNKCLNESVQRSCLDYTAYQRHLQWSLSVCWCFQWSWVILHNYVMKTLSAFLSRVLVLFYSITAFSIHRLQIWSLKGKKTLLTPVVELGCNHIMQIIICIYQMKTKWMRVLHCLQYNPVAYMLQSSVNRHNCMVMWWK